jgi:hypothetical protein
MQPYEHLAAVLRAEGKEADARQILLEREHRVTKLRNAEYRAAIRETDYPWSVGQCVKASGHWTFRHAYRLLAGYGYQAARSVSVLLLLAVAAYALTVLARDAGAIESRTVASPTQVASTTPPCDERPPARSGGRASSPQSLCPEQTEAAIDVNEVVFAAERLIPAVDLGERSRWRATGYYGFGLGVITILGWICTLALIASLNKTLRRD